MWQKLILERVIKDIDPLNKNNHALTKDLLLQCMQ